MQLHSVSGMHHDSLFLTHGNQYFVFELVFILFKSTVYVCVRGQPTLSFSLEKFDEVEKKNTLKNSNVMTPLD